MSKQDFLNNFRVARNLFFHPGVDADGSHLDPQALGQKLARAAIWLTPRSVEGFDASDFSELGPDRQRDLRAAIRDFRAVASQVPPDKPPTAEQLANARAAFVTALGILEPYVPTETEGKRVEEVLSGVDFPSWVVNWDYELGKDEDDEPAVWVNLFADESSSSPREYGRQASQITQKIRQALTAAGVNRWPYLRVRTAAEHKSA